MFATSAPRALILATLGSLALLACSADDGRVVMLDVEPAVTIDLPEGLSSTAIRDLQSISPRVTLSNGDAVSMTRGTGNQWSGTVNVTAGREYTATVVWNENYYGQPLMLATLEQQMSVSDIGNVTVISSTGYDTRIDTDNDGVDNLRERQDGTNPFDADNFNPGSVTDETAMPNGTADDAANDEVLAERYSSVSSGVAVDDMLAAVDVMIPRIAAEDAPVIDGKGVTTDSEGLLTGEWSLAVQQDNSGARLLIDSLMIDVDAEESNRSALRRWAAMHDGTWLYVLVFVDDDGQRERDSGPALTDDDSLEIFIDGDNTQQTRYDDNDFHRILPVTLADEDRQSASSDDVAGPRSSTAPLPLDFATGPGIGPDGLRSPRFEQDVYELRIAIDSAGIDPDQPFGIELQVNDDDDGGGRVSKWGWKHAPRGDDDVNGTTSDPSLMGTARLE